MSLDAIIAKINADADERIDEIKAQAQGEIDALNADISKKLGGTVERIESSGKDKAARTEERLVSLAELASRKRMLAARQQILDKLFEEANAEMSALKKSDYQRAFSSLLGGAELSGSFEVVTSKREATWLTKKLLSSIKGVELSLSEENKDYGGGFVLRHGRTELNFSFSALARSARPDLERELLTALKIVD
jgi:V/A-type H+-transporting ATPase subunit E